MTTIDDALDGLSAREAERLKARLEKRLQACVFDPDHAGARAVRVTWKVASGTQRGSVMVCPACLERIRLPESRSE